MIFGSSSFIWVSPFSDQTYDIIDRVRRFGFDAIEICIEDPGQLNPHRLAQYIQEAQCLPLICGAFGPDRDISSEDERIRQSGIDYLKTCIDYAGIIGSELVSGPMYSATGKTRLQSAEEKQRQWSWAVENMKIVADYAEERGVRLAFEPLNRFETDFINTVEQGLELIEKVGSEQVGFLLDTFHMNIEEKNMSNAIRLAGDRIYNFHACENDRGTPGTGHIDWSSVFEALHDISYDGPVVIESFTADIKEIARAVSLWRPLAPTQDSIAEEGLKFLKKVASKPKQ